MIIGSRHHAYLARRHGAPPSLPNGFATIELGDLVRHITRAQDPNLPGFDPAATIAEYAVWPFYRYGPLLSSRALLRGLGVIDRLDPRKKGIVAEDVGLGFAAHAMARLGASPMMTKWEIGQRDRRARLEAMLVQAGQPPSMANRVGDLISRGLGGADFIGHSLAMGGWVVCESKGSLGEPPDEADINAVIKNPEGPALGRNGLPVATVPQYQHGLRQKRRTEREVQGWGVGDVVAMAVFTALGSEGNGRLTVVDYVDPEPSAELREALVASQPSLRELICETHFAWMSALFGLGFNLWRAGDAVPAQAWDQGGLFRQIAIELADSALRFELHLDSAALAVIASGSVGDLDIYAVNRPDTPDGLTCQVTEGPDFVDETTDQTARDRAALDRFDVDVIDPIRRPVDPRPLELEDR
jgi:hypothetical protein